MTTLTWATVCLMVYASSLIDLPRLVRLGPVSGFGMLTLFYNFCVLLLWGLAPSLTGRLLSTTWLLCLFLLWGSVSLAWCPSLGLGFQNLAVMTAFVGAMLLCSRESYRSPWFRAKVQKSFARSAAFSMALYAIGLVIAVFGAEPIVSGRAFALFALIGLAYHLSAWRYGAKRALLWAAVITVFIGFSLSRMAFVAALALFPLAQRPSRGARELVRVAIWLVLVATAGYTAITYAEPLHDRFFSGDMSLEIGGVRFNASGRTVFWKATVNSYMESWLFGKGAGSSEVLVQTSFVDIDHPHNDYLRILHDYGLVGLVLWLSGMCALLWHVGRAWIRADRLNFSEAPLHLSAFLVLVAVSLVMTSDNPIVYIYIMGPAGALVGTSLGAKMARRAARPSFIASTPSCAHALPGAVE